MGISQNSKSSQIFTIVSETRTAILQNSEAGGRKLFKSHKNKQDFRGFLPKSEKDKRKTWAQDFFEKPWKPTKRISSENSQVKYTLMGCSKARDTSTRF